MQLRLRSRSAFTIVELLIVIVVIAVLAAITVVSYNGISRQAAQAALRAEVSNAATELGLYHVRNGDYYPTTGNLADAGVEDTNEVTFEYTSDSGLTYCLTGTSERARTSYFISPTSGGTQDGACDGHTGYAAAAVITPVGTAQVAAGQFFSAALAEDGRVYAWGHNNNGQLGNGTTEFAYVPVDVVTTGTPMEGKTITAIAAGFHHMIALASDGSLYSWGDNQYGQLGNGSTADSSLPVAVTMAGTPMDGKTIVAISAGPEGYHSLALAADGTVFGWGYDAYGQLGDGGTTDQTTAVAVATAGTPMDGAVISAISAGSSHSLALSSDGVVYSWGRDNAGQLGDGGSVDQTVPVAVTTSGVLSGKTVAAISAGGSHSVVLTSDAGVYTWGSGGQGQLGRSSSSNSAVPVAVTTSGVLSGKTIVGIKAGAFHTMAVGDDGAGYAWGDNRYGGRLGIGSAANYSTAPAAVVFSGTPMDGESIVGYAAGRQHTVAYTESGGVYAWGDNSFAQIGNGLTADSSTALVTTAPAGPIASRTVESIVTGGYHNVALTTDGEVYSWGWNDNAQLGVGSTTGSYLFTPPAVTGTPLEGKNIVSAAVGVSHTMVLDSDGVVYAWGDNRYGGRIGNGSTANYVASPVAVTTTGTPMDGKTIVDIAAGRHHSVAAASDGTVYAWGYNSFAQLGDGGTTNSSVPIATTITGTPMEGHSIVKVTAGQYSTMALASDGTMYGWGHNNNGQLGNNSTAFAYTPDAVVITGTPLEGKAIVDIAAGLTHTVALASDGTVYAWGDNASGQLGNGTGVDSHIPVAVTFAGTPMDGKTIAAIAVGQESSHSVALASDGSVYAWGDNGYGQLGDGTTTDRPLAVEVDAGVYSSLQGKTVVGISAGVYHTIALASDGSIHAWGSNNYGQVGDGAAVNYSIPTAIMKNLWRWDGS